MSLRFSRRRFLQKSLATSGSFYLLGVPAQAESSTSQTLNFLNSNLSFFSETERKTLACLSDTIFPGASSLGAVNYIETLLTAFDTEPPKLFAAGPFSQEAHTFIPLTRAQEQGWRLRIYGSSYFKNGWWNEGVLGPYKGLREIFKEGLKRHLDFLPEDFQKALRGLVLEGCFSSPFYGGNFKQQGWKLATFPGGSQPKGYSLSEVSQGDSADPYPLTTSTRVFLFFVTLFQRGRIYR